MRFAANFFDADNPSWLKRAVVGVFLFITAFHVWNAWHFNPYWGYDGGGHLDYIFSLADGHWPSIETNYIAWHEPLYYLLMSIVAKIHRGLHTLGFVQVMLSMAVAAVSWLVIQKVTKSAWARVMTFVVWNCLPAVTMASAFVTNELLSYFFITLILYVALAKKGPVIIGVICGLALITKITAIIAVAVVLFDMGKRKEWKQAFVVAAIALLFYAPWLVFRTKNILPSLSINNTAYMAPAPLALDGRIMFFVKFDADIFTFPFWYSGGRGFWSMLYADTFWDYGNMMKNPDVLAALSRDEKVATDRNGGEVSRSTLRVTRSLPYLAIPLALIMLLGLYELLKRPLYPHSLFSLLSLCALLYFSYRYPFYDRGIVKSIFIAPAFLPIFAAGFTAAETRMKHAWGKPVISVLVFVYVATLLSTMTMTAQGY